MTTLNAYATLAEFKNYIVARSTTAEHVSTTDTVDDTVIEQLLKVASRYLDSKTQRRFIPHIETHYYDVPDSDSLDPRLLELDDDLLEVISVTNGDGTTIASTEYSLKPKNKTPYYGIRLNDSSVYSWVSDDADTHDVIAVTGVWGYHNDYVNAWLLGSTLNEELDASETGIDVTSGTPFAIGDFIRFENELGYLSAVATNTLTGTRGANGSTAATHTTAKSVYIWQPMEEVKTACLEIANNAYHRRFGQSLRSEETITAAGIVLSPREIPHMAKEFIKTYQRYT